MEHDTDQTPAAAQEQPPASLRIEFRSSDPKLRASFRQAIVDWLTGAEGGLSRALGLPEGLAVDEPGERGESMEIRARWWHFHRGSRPKPSTVAAERIVFAPEAMAPVYREFPAVIPTFEIGRAAAGPRPAAGRPPRRVSGQAALAAGSHVLRNAIRASAFPVLTVRLPAWRLRPAAVILSALTVATVGLTYGAIRAEEVHPDTTVARAPTAAVGGILPLAPAAVGTTQTVPGGANESEPASRADAIVAAVAPGPAPAMTEAVAPVPAVDVAAPSAAAPRPSPRAPRPAAPVTAAASGPQRAATTPFTGSLAVTSTPAGAEVSINGVARGRTPVVISGIPAGSRVVRLELEGYRRWSWAVTVTGRARTPLAVKLQPEAPASVRTAVFER